MLNCVDPDQVEYRISLASRCAFQFLGISVTVGFRTRVEMAEQGGAVVAEETTHQHSSPTESSDNHRAGPVEDCGFFVNVSRGSLREQILINKPASDVWKLVGAPERLSEWFPGIVESHVEGDVRTITTDAGNKLPEQILTIDPVAMRFQYRITAPIVKEHLGTVDVVALGDDSCLVLYSTDADPRTFALMISGAAGTALEELKRIVEGT